MSKLCYVTSFFDIGREKWNYYNRNFDVYFKAFTKMINMFKKFNCVDSVKSVECVERVNFSLYYEVIVFIDERYYNRVVECVDGLCNVTVVSINDEFMRNNIPIWSRLEREGEIMSSETFKNLVKHRYRCPETYEPKYTLINHAKVDFVNFAGIISQAEYFCWLDFGYCGEDYSIADAPLDINKFDKERINYVLLNPLTEEDNDVVNTIVVAREKVSGGFFFCSREKMEEYRKLYSDVHKWFQDNNLADDDQNLVIQCNFRRPDLFKFECLYGWFKGLTHYSIKC